LEIFKSIYYFESFRGGLPALDKQILFHRLDGGLVRRAFGSAAQVRLLNE